MGTTAAATPGPSVGEAATKKVSRPEDPAGGASQPPSRRGSQLQLLPPSSVEHKSAWLPSTTTTPCSRSKNFAYSPMSPSMPESCRVQLRPALVVCTTAKSCEGSSATTQPVEVSPKSMAASRYEAAATGTAPAGSCLRKSCGSS